MPTLGNPLPPNSIELDGLLLGPTTPLMIEDVDFGTPEILNNDTQRPRADGVWFGRDLRGGRLITISMQLFADSGPAAVAFLAKMETAWLAEGVRDVAGATSVLRYNTGGRTRRVYGRPRKFAPVSLRANANGWAPVVAEFLAGDHKYYSDTELSNTVSIVPPDAGGFIAPFHWPLTTEAISYAPGVITVHGDGQCWPVFVINGPITSPEIRAVEQYVMKFPGLSLARGETLVVDSRPWSRGVRRNDVVNVSNSLDAHSPPLSRVGLKPGVYEIVLAGTDPTGTSSMTVAWREVYNSF